MSWLSPEVHATLSQLLRALSTPDNAVRSQAEEQLNNDWVQNRPDVLLMGLVEQIEGAEDTVVSLLSRGGKQKQRGAFAKASEDGIDGRVGAKNEHLCHDLGQG